MDGQERHKELWNAVQEAQKIHIRAAAAFDALVVDPSSASINGHLEPFADERRLAFERYVQALGAFRTFVKEQLHKP